MDAQETWYAQADLLSEQNGCHYRPRQHHGKNHGSHEKPRGTEKTRTTSRCRRMNNNNRDDRRQQKKINTCKANGSRLTDCGLHVARIRHVGLNSSSQARPRGTNAPKTKQNAKETRKNSEKQTKIKLNQNNQIKSVEISIINHLLFIVYYFI